MPAKRRVCCVKAGALMAIFAAAAILRAEEPREAADAVGARSAANQSVGIEESPRRTDGDVAVSPLVADPPSTQTALPTIEKAHLPPRGERRLRTTEREQPPSPSPSSPAGLVGLWPLLAVTALIGAVYVVMRRVRGSGLTGATGAMRVLGRLHLTPRHQLTLVQVGQRVLVVGVSANDMRTLHVVDDAEEAAMLMARAGGTRGDAAFAEWLDKEGESFADPQESEAVESSRRGPRGVSELLKKVRTMQTTQ